MKKGLVVFTSIVILLTGTCLPANAQFWKKVFGKEEKKPVRKVPPRSTQAGKANSKTGAAATKKKGPEPLKLAPTVKKDRYRIDVLAPVYLNELVAGGKAVYKSHLPDKVLPGLGFYQGIKLAADTLNELGYHMDVYFHDISDPAQNIDALIKKAALDSSDLIIGAVPSQQVALLAGIAKKHNINFVSTLTPADGSVRGNLYFNLLQPTLQRHCEAVKNAVSKKGRTANILVYHRSTVPIDETCFKNITRDSAFTYAKVSMSTPMASDKLRNFLDSNVDNVIVMPIVDITYATQLLEQLSKSFPNYDFEVYGMPSWKGLSFLRKEGKLPNVGITIGSPFYFDISTSGSKAFSDVYTRVFGGKPGEMAYRGYETLYWYATLLNEYGTVFNDHFADADASPFTNFNFKVAEDKDGLPLYYENNNIYLYRYQGGSFSISH